MARDELIAMLTLVLMPFSATGASACGIPGLDTLLRSDAVSLVEKACDLAMEKGNAGEAFKFQDPGISVLGSVTAGDAFRDGAGLYCRRLTITLVHPSAGHLERRRWPGVACRAGHLDWKWADVEIRELGDTPARTGMRALQQRF